MPRWCLHQPGSRGRKTVRPGHPGERAVPCHPMQRGGTSAPAGLPGTPAPPLKMRQTTRQAAHSGGGGSGVDGAVCGRIACVPGGERDDCMLKVTKRSPGEDSWSLTAGSSPRRCPLAWMPSIPASMPRLWPPTRCVKSAVTSLRGCRLRGPAGACWLFFDPSSAALSPLEPKRFLSPSFDSAEFSLVEFSLSASWVNSDMADGSSARDNSCAGGVGTLRGPRDCWGQTPARSWGCDC